MMNGRMMAELEKGACQPLGRPRGEILLPNIILSIRLARPREPQSNGRLGISADGPSFRGFTQDLDVLPSTEPHQKRDLTSPTANHALS